LIPASVPAEINKQSSSFSRDSMSPAVAAWSASSSSSNRQKVQQQLIAAATSQ
jgi:hypothetical protein